MTPVAGQENIFDMVRADEPTQEGTPLNKATLLKDATAAILGLPNTAVPDDAFLALALPAGKYAISVTLKSPRRATHVRHFAFRHCNRCGKCCCY